MSKKEIVVIDYGLGNLLSVERAIEKCGAVPIITDNSNIIINSDKVILPGVGAFRKGMEALKLRGLDNVIKNLFIKKTPLLGICLGMQLLFDSSEEFGYVKGLGILPGKVLPIPTKDKNFKELKIPNNGWRLLKINNQNLKNKTFFKFKSIENSEYYFTHSYMALPDDNSINFASCVYGGHNICSVVIIENFIGTQFHPEKSGKAGLNLLKIFIDQS